MTYDSEVRATSRRSGEDYQRELRGAKGVPWWVAQTLMTTLDAIPPLTLKTEDGRFVKVASVQIEWDDEMVPAYVVVDEDPTQ